MAGMANSAHLGDMSGEAVMTEKVAGECCNSVLLMPTKVAAHFANRLLPFPECLDATVFCMGCRSDAALEILVTF